MDENAGLRWHWIDDGFLPLVLAGMRAVWVGLALHIWSAWVQPPRGDMLSPWLVFGLLAGGTAAAQLGTFRLRRVGPGMALAAGGGLFGVVLALYLGFAGGRAPWDPAWFPALLETPLATFFTLAIAAWLWWWGLLIGRGQVFYDTYANNFSLGVGILAFLVAVTYSTRVIPPVQSLAALLLFFALGLGVLAIASVQTTRRSERRTSQQSFRLSRYWLGTVAVTIGVLLLLALGLAQLFTPGVLERIMAAASFVLDLAAQVILVVAAIVVYPFFLLADLLRRFIHLRRNEPQPDQPIAVPNLADQLKNVQESSAGLSSAALLTLRIVGGVLLLVAVVLLFAFAYRRLRGYFEEEDTDETRDLIFSRALLRAQLAEFFGRRREGPRQPPFVAVAGEDARARVRRTYQALLAWAAGQGVPRQPGLTPAEYAGALNRALPEHAQAVTAITAAYDRARYSHGALPDAVADDATRAWATIASRPRRA